MHPTTPERGRAGRGVASLAMVAGTVLAVAGPLQGETIVVDPDGSTGHATIGSAIDAASPETPCSSAAGRTASASGSSTASTSRASTPAA